MSKFLSSLVDKLFPSRKLIMESESLLSVLSRENHQSIPKKDLREYFLKHFSGSEFQKVVDFPSDSPWINTSGPLSIHRDLRGKIVLLDFFTYCCINCMHILPDLKTLEKKYTVQDGLVVIGVHRAKFDNEKETKNVASAVKRYEIEHAIVNDSNGTIWNAFDAHCWPTLILIGPHGELLLSLSGEGHLKLLDSVIEVCLEVMKEKKILSSHPLPQIKDTDELKSFGALLFPGKVASYVTETMSFIGIADTGNHRILITDDNGTIQFTIGGLDPGFQDGDFASSKFRAPQGLVFKDDHTVYVADTENHAIREINLSTKKVTTVAGTGKQGQDFKGGNLWTDQEISSPWDVCFGKNNNVLLIAMAGHHQIWALYLSDEDQYLFKKGKMGECKAVAGSGREENRNNSYPHAAAFAQPSGLAYCPDRDSILIADSESSTVRELNLESGKVNAVVGGDKNPSNLFAFGDRDGVAYDVKLQHALGVTWHNEEKILYVADSYNHKLKKVDVFKNSCSTEKVQTEFDEPGGVCAHGNKILIADTNHHCIKVYDLQSSSITTMSIRLPEKACPESSNEEKIIEISEAGGDLNVQITLKMNQDVTMTENAPAYWLINFCDENLQKLPGCEIREDLKLESKLSIRVPESSQKPFTKVLLEGALYVCKRDLCSMENLRFVIDLRRSKTAGANQSCNFTHVIDK